MIKQLKHILLDMARLSPMDQRWILQRLSSTELKKFEQWRGMDLLKDAQRFSTVNKADVGLPLDVPPTVLPEFCQGLSNHPPLYIAIMLEHSAYDAWREQFLSTYDQDGAIRAALEHEVLDIKPAVKHAVFNEWEQSVPFDFFLDNPHG